MTEHDFTELSFSTDPSEMDDEDRIETLTDFKESHDENAEAFQELRDEAEDLAEFKEEYQPLAEADVSAEEVLEFQETLREKAAEGTPMEPDEISMSFSRLFETAVEQAGSASGGEGDEEGEGGEDPEFSESNESEAGKFEGEEDYESPEFVRESMSKKFSL